MGEIIGYARCSSAAQNLDRQRDALTVAGAGRLYEEKITGSRRDRPQLTAMLDYARSGDVIVVTELARLGRTLTDLLDIVNGLGKRGIEFRSLKENIDTSTPSGRLLFHLMAALAEFERDVINERAAEGRAAARARGRTGGRPRVDQAKLDAARLLVESGKSSAEAARTVGVGRATLYRHGIGVVAGSPE
jgi:DNA invertase Pin-like site-specific DNA recombinase